jgi:type VI secretion system protein ImpL
VRIEQRLAQYVSEPEKLYEYLKAYLMLGHPEHLDRAQLGFIADLEWQAIAGAQDSETGGDLSRHFNALLEDEDGLRPVALDESLVEQARSTIRQASIPSLIYREIRLTYAGDSARALRLDLAAGVGAQRVLRRRSGVSLSQPVLSLYTPVVFKEVVGRGTADIVAHFATDQWVWGDAGVPRVSSTKLAVEVIDIYEKDYIAAWDRIVKDIEPAPLGSLTNTDPVGADLPSARAAEGH